MILTLIASANMTAWPGTVSFISKGERQSNIADERGIVALDQTLRELTNPFTVMCVAASPDGIDDGTLAYYHKNLGARAVIVLATRGEAEPGLMAGRFGNELGVLRTREALDSARLIGADLYFLNLRHVGPSKSADEVLASWGHQEASMRLSTAVSLLRPDVIITAGARADDGYQQALSRLMLDLFNAAENRKEQNSSALDYWKPSRWFEQTKEPDANVSVVLDEYDIVRGRSYAEIGLEARKQRISYGSSLDHLTSDLRARYYKQVAATGDAVKPARQKSLLDGLQIPENLAVSIKPPLVQGSPAFEAIGLRDALIETLKEKLHDKRLEAGSGSFRDRYGAQFHRAVRFTEALERSLAIALGLNLSISLSDGLLVRGQKVTARITLRNGSAQHVSAIISSPKTLPHGTSLPEMKAAEPTGAIPGGATVMEIEFQAPADASFTLPHSQRLYDERYYAIGSALPGAQPSAPFGNRMLIVAEVLIGEVTIPVAAAIRFDVAPVVEIETIPFALVKNWETSREIEMPVRIRNRTPGALSGSLWVVPLALSKDDYVPARLDFVNQDEEIVVKLKLTLPILKPPLSPDLMLEFRSETPSSRVPLGSAKVIIKAGEFDVTGGIKVGYIKGAGDWLSTALTALGVEHREVSQESLLRADHGNSIISTSSAESNRPCGGLAGIDTLIIDNDAIALRPDLTGCNPCLLDYVKRGGNLLMLSQRADDWNLIACRSRFAPYPLSLSTERVALETAPVKIVEETHPVVTLPNILTQKDFEGWSFERASSVAIGWGDGYSAPLETGDPGEDARRGVLIVARHGEGSFIYSALALRPQLLEGHAGAYRLLANLISFGKVIKQGETTR
jgi:LmbE family N-acetylglucosaminyl deacetylase